MPGIEPRPRHVVYLRAPVIDSNRPRPYLRPMPAAGLEAYRPRYRPRLDPRPMPAAGLEAYRPRYRPRHDPRPMPAAGL